MTLTLEITPEMEQALARRAAAYGLEVPAYAVSLLEQAAESSTNRDSSASSAIDLIELFAPLRGLNLERDPDTGRDIVL